MLFPRPDFFDDAKCRGLTSLFFPDQGETARHAKAVCAGCSVTAECLEYAQRNGEAFGVWGGRSPRDRGVNETPFRRKACEYCGFWFEYERRPGVHRLYCSLDCLQTAKAERRVS